MLCTRPAGGIPVAPGWDPAKFAYEVHLELKSQSSSLSARNRGIGLFGHYHNDHFWVLYHDGSNWVPFDSAMGITGWDGFVRRKVLEPAGGVANPPFIVWEDTGQGRTGMRNITAEFWKRIGIKSVRGVPESQWLPFVQLFDEIEADDLNRPISPGMEARIAEVARQFFGVPKIKADQLDDSLQGILNSFEHANGYVYLIEQDVNRLGYGMLKQKDYEKAVALFF